MAGQAGTGVQLKMADHSELKCSKVLRSEPLRHPILTPFSWARGTSVGCGLMWGGAGAVRVAF